MYTGELSHNMPAGDRHGLKEHKLYPRVVHNLSTGSLAWWWAGN